MYIRYLLLAIFLVSFLVNTTSLLINVPNNRFRCNSNCVSLKFVKRNINHQQLQQPHHIQLLASTLNMARDSKGGGDAKGDGPRKPKAPKDDVVQVNGKVVESLPNAMFRVEIEPSKQVII